MQSKQSNVTMALSPLFSKVEGDKPITCLYSRELFFKRQNSGSQGVSSLSLKPVPVSFTRCQKRDTSKGGRSTVIPHTAVVKLHPAD